jgi:hypothetical protein
VDFGRLNEEARSFFLQEETEITEKGGRIVRSNLATILATILAFHRQGAATFLSPKAA